METRDRLAEVQQEVAKRLASGDAVVKESQSLAKQSQEQLVALQTKLGELENRLAESKSQQETLENLYQNLARNNEESTLVDIEQSMTSASEQLQLAGNVQGAVFALQAADARLAGSSRPQFISLRKVLARDLERLRALPQTDLPGMYLRLENVMVSVDSLPLANGAIPPQEVSAPAAPATPPQEASAPAETPATPPDTQSHFSFSSSPLLTLDYWRALAGDLWKEVRGLIRIQRLDRDEPALLAPGQGFFLRENLKLRLLNARLALLSRDQWTYRNELQRAQEWMQRYFEVQDKGVQSSLTALKELSSTEISSELPNLNESLSAIKNFRADKERERDRR